MNRRRTRFIRAAFFTALVLVIARAASHRLTGDRAIFPPSPAAAAPDTAAAMRSISGTAPPSKPWVTDLTAYTARHGGQWIVGRCAGPALSQAEAQQSARTDAARAVYDIAITRLGFTHGDQRWLAQRVQSDVQAGKLLSDELPEQFNRPYATIWTDAVLLDVSPEKLDRLLDQYRNESNLRSNRNKHVELAGGIVIAGTWLACLLCNAVTRGYFSLRLQMIAGTVTAIALLVFLGGT